MNVLVLCNGYNRSTYIIYSFEYFKFTCLLWKECVHTQVVCMYLHMYVGLLFHSLILKLLHGFERHDSRCVGGE